jgi:hypothetical protein
MKKSGLLCVARNRRDHYVPRGYLRGFMHPERERHPKPLWVLDIKRGQWSEKSPSQVGWERAYYDYPPDSNPDATADDSFRHLERYSPASRSHPTRRVQELDSASRRAGGVRRDAGRTESAVQGSSGIAGASVSGG